MLRMRYLPTWIFQLVDIGRYVAGAMKRYPLADQANSLSCQPLFIVSAGRSGTTLLRSMLAVGGQIAIPPESQVIPYAVRRYLSLQHLGWTDLSRLIIALFESHTNFHQWEINLYPAYRRVIHLSQNERSLARAIDEVFCCYAAQRFPKANVWGDQSPINTLYLPWIFRTFPEARYLHLLRDGRDAISSMVAKGASVRTATDRWVRAVEQVLALEPRLGDDQFLEVRYEALVTEPISTLQVVCTFIGIEYSAQMLDFWKSATTIEHRHFEHHRNLGRPLFTESVGRWAERLSAAEQQSVLTKTADLLRRFNYLD